MWQPNEKRAYMVLDPFEMTIWVTLPSKEVLADSNVSMEWIVKERNSGN